jgi:hypothetical protein
MLKIQNVSKIKGKIVNGCRVLDIEYNSVQRGYIFTMEDTHSLNSEKTGQFLIKLLDSNYEVDEYEFFVMGWKVATERSVTKQKISDVNGFANQMYELIERGVKVLKSYNSK